VHGDLPLDRFGRVKQAVPRQGARLVEDAHVFDSLVGERVRGDAGVLIDLSGDRSGWRPAGPSEPAGDFQELIGQNPARGGFSYEIGLETQVQPEVIFDRRQEIPDAEQGWLWTLHSVGVRLANP